LTRLPGEACPSKPAAKETPVKATVENLKKCFENLVPADVLANLDPSKPLTVQGVDSLALTAMAVAIQNAFNVTIGVEDGVKLKTLNDVADFLNRS
jgi:acyl carrier protein